MKNKYKGVIEYRFNGTKDSKEKVYTIRYNGFWQYIFAMINVRKKRPDVIIEHKKNKK